MAAVFHIYNLKRKIEDEFGLEVADDIIPATWIFGDNKTPEEKSNTMNLIIRRMESTISSNDIIKIRKKTTCGITKKQTNIILKAKESSDSLIEQAQMINKSIAPSKIEINENIVFTFGYRKCICKMFKNIKNAKSTKAFCYCCAGNVEKIISYWLGKQTEMEIVETCLTGYKDCIFTNV